MSNLITALAAAHGAILAQPEPDAALLSTARKIEGTLIDQLKGCTEKERADVIGVILNSGSLKALKLVPENARPSRYTFNGQNSPKPDFILAQPASYLREAFKRGFTIGANERLNIFKKLAQTPDHPGRKQMEALVIASPSEECTPSQSYFASLIIKEVLEMGPEAANVAALAVKILKASYKADKAASDQYFANFFGIYDPAAASEQLYSVIAIYAMLGAARPPKDVFEHDEMERLAKAITTAQGRKDLVAATGGLEVWLAGGHRKPPAIIAEFERKRLSWRPPHASRGNRFSGGLLARR